MKAKKRSLNLIYECPSSEPFDSSSRVKEVFVADFCVPRKRSDKCARVPKQKVPASYCRRIKSKASIPAPALEQ